MNFKPLLLKLERSKEYSDFINENPKAFICAGFFIRDFVDGNNQSSIDLFSGGKIFTFSLKDSIFQVKQEPIFDKTKTLSKINTNITLDIEELSPLIEHLLKENEIKGKLEKIIAVLQKNNEDTIWNLTCIVAGMKIILVHINATTKEVIKFEKRSLFDFVRK